MSKVRPEFQKSSFCPTSATCVGVVFDRERGVVLMANTGDPEGKTLEFTPEEFGAFRAGVKNNEFDF